MGAAYVAFYLGVSLTTVHNWVKNPRVDFPAPDHVVIGLKGKNSAFSWDSSALPGLRLWVERKNEMNPAEAVARWASIDKKLAEEHDDTALDAKTPSDIHPGQIAFSIPSQRISPEQSEAA
jgi:hypothetical protein